MLLLEAQCLLQGVQVFGIENGGKGGAVDGAFGGHGVLAHVSCVGYLLGKYNNVQTHKK